MLSISNVTPSQGANYFKQENYYSKEEAEEQSNWFGQGADALGLSGSVDSEQFKNLLEGYSPDGKKTLSGKKINLTNRRAGFDLTFSAPKSFSLAALMGEAKKLEQAHRNAVERTLKVVEQQHAQARVWDGREQQKVNTGNLVVAQFHHTTSREKDPQLHTHCVVLNCTQLENGKWRALTNEELYNNEMLLGAIYRNELASEARQLGYEIESRPDGLFEIKGYSETQLEWFSKRRQQILELVGEHATAKEKQWAALQTRAAKGKELPREEQLGWWQAQNEAFNLQIQHPIPQVNIQPTSVDVAIPENSAAAAVTAAIEHCSEKTVAFKRKALEKFIFSEIKFFSYAELEKAIANDPELIATFDGRFTTQTAINRELETIRLMQEGKNRVDSIADKETVKLCLAELTLTQGQEDAIALATTATDRFIAWQGVAGAGKTYALNEFKVIAADQGYTIRGFAPSSEAAAVLGDEVGIETNTVASLLLSEQPEDIEDKQIWIVDEAGLLSAKDAHNLLKLATNQKARVILVGDTKQLSAVEAGNPFKSLQSAGISTAYLNQSLRQRVKDLQESVDLVAAGKIEQGMERLNGANRIAVIPDAEERLAQFVKDYMALSPEERDKTLVLTGTNSDRQFITSSIRQELKAEGVLGTARSLTGLKAKDLSQVQTRYSHYYAVGDVVVPTREYKCLGLTKFQPYTVEALDKNSLTLVATNGTRCTVDPMAFRKTVYEQQSIEIAVGDHIKWTRNDRKLGRRNGQQFVVTAISGNHAQIKYANGKTDEVDLKQLQHLDYAIVSTTYSSQGKTADRVMIAADKTMGKESFYVAVSRAKYDLKIYTEDKSDLLKLARKSKAKEIAIELISSKPVGKLAATTKQSISTTTQLPTTNEEITHERTHEPARPAADTEQFKPGDGNAVGRSVNERLNAHSRKARPDRSVPAELHESGLRGMATTVRQLTGSVRQPTSRKPGVPGHSRSTERPSRRFNSNNYRGASTNSKLGGEIRQPDPRLQQLSHSTGFPVEHLESSDRVDAAIENAGTTTPKADNYARKANRQLESELPTISQSETRHSQLESELQQIGGDITALVERLESGSRLDGKFETGTGKQSSFNATNSSTNRQPSRELRQFAENVNTFVQHVSSASRANAAASPYQAERLTDLSSSSQPVNDDQNFNQEQEQISHDIKQRQLSPERTADEQHSIDQLHSPIDQESWATREQQQPVEHENRAVGEQQQPVKRTNSPARNYPNREFEGANNKLPELLETISRYLELQGVEQLGNHIAELNRSLNDGWLRGQGTTLFSNRDDGQDATITDRAASHGGVRGQDGSSQRTDRQLLNAIASSVVSEAIAQGAVLESIANYIDQTAVESGIRQTVAILTEQIAQHPTGLSEVMTQLDTIISDRLQKLDALKTNLEKERNNRATEALSNYVDSSVVESALGETVSLLVGQFSEYRQQLASDETNSSINILLNRLESVSHPRDNSLLREILE